MWIIEIRVNEYTRTPTRTRKWTSAQGHEKVYCYEGIGQERN